ncbi:unnamed protein product [Ectocarpus sp. 4 AP-2014]
MAGARAPIPPVSLPDNVVLMEDMALYAERIDLQGMMQEFLRRVLLSKPQDPIGFLITQMKKNPYKAPGYPSERDQRTVEEKAKHACRKTSTERARLLQEIFQAVEPEPGTQLVSKARLIVMLNERPGILLERFPHHVDNILRAVARMKTESDAGMTLTEFRENAGRVLREAGGGIK